MYQERIAALRKKESELRQSTHLRIVGSVPESEQGSREVVQAYDSAMKAIAPAIARINDEIAAIYWEAFLQEHLTTWLSGYLQAVDHAAACYGRNSEDDAAERFYQASITVEGFASILIPTSLRKDILGTARGLLVHAVFAARATVKTKVKMEKALNDFDTRWHRH